MNAHFRVCWSCQLAALRRVDRVFRAEFESRSNPSTRGWGTGLGWIQMSNPYPNPRLTRTLTRGFPIPVMIPNCNKAHRGVTEEQLTRRANRSPIASEG